MMRLVTKWRRLSCLVILFLFASGITVKAQEALLLTLEQARNLVLLQNLQIESEELAYEAARRIYRAERGALFEPELVLGAERVNNERENTAEQFIAQGVDDFKERNVIYDIGVEQRLITGGSLRFGYALRNLENNLREQRDLEGPERDYDSFLGVTFVQPLLRDGGLGPTLAMMRLARAESEAALQEWRRGMMQVLAGAEAAYWDLYIAQERVAFRADSVRVAEQILEDNKARVEAGRMSDLEVQQAEAGLALRQAQHFEALQQQIETSSRLKTFFSELMESAQSSIVATDSPVIESLELNQAEAHRLATTLHPDYLLRIHRLEQDNIRLAFARNQVLPQVDLQASYGFNGLGETASEAWRKAEDGDFVSWSVGVQVRVPLGGGVRARNELGAARARARQGLLGLEAAGIELSNELTVGMERVMNHYQQVARHRRIVAMNEALLGTELARLELGQSDSRKVLDAEEQLTEARERLASSMARYMVAMLELELSNGTLLLNRSADPMQSDAYVARLPADRRGPPTSEDAIWQSVPRGGAVTPVQTRSQVDGPEPEPIPDWVLPDPEPELEGDPLDPFRIAPRR